jgi:4-amino-4-deoxy-L-arabinose transferase-like glycosyltransferase
MDTLALLLGLLAVYAAVRLLRSPRFLWWVGFGVAVGLTVSTKYTGLLAAAGSAVPLWLSFTRERSRGRAARFTMGGIGSVAVAAALIVASNPVL